MDSCAGGRQKMHVDERYPVGVPGEIPSIVLQRDKQIEFNCSSLDEISNCNWIGPFSAGHPCSISS